MSIGTHEGVMTLGGVHLDQVLERLRRLEPHARACWIYDVDAFAARVSRLQQAAAPLRAVNAYALKANSLPSLLARILAAGLEVDAGSIGELESARAAGFGPTRRTLSGNGRTPEEAAWVAREGVAAVSADSLAELDLLEAAATEHGRIVRVALRVNPGIGTPGHRHVATGHEGAKFGVSREEALQAWNVRARWPHLCVDGLHLHVGSQLLEREPLVAAAQLALALARSSAERGAPLALINLGGGFGVDYAEQSDAFPLEMHLAELAELPGAMAFEWRLEPGRWLVAPVGVLLAEVLAVKLRRDPSGERRFVVLAAGMNDLLRPALYGARHRIVPVRPRAGGQSEATVVGPVCESGDTFETAALLPPLEVGDVVALLDTGAYGAVMSSNYNGRPRLAELVIDGGRLRRARRGEMPSELLARATDDPLDSA
ncbi:MAG: diaminopimelate decarboxylase [Candidatus Eisenbacteria bacterium]